MQGTYYSGPQPHTLVSVVNRVIFQGNSASSGEISVCFEAPDSEIKEFIQSVPYTGDSNYNESRSIFLSPNTYTVTIYELVVSSGDFSYVDTCHSGQNIVNTVFWSGTITLTDVGFNYVLEIGGVESNPVISIRENIPNRPIISVQNTPLTKTWENNYTTSGSALSQVTTELFKGIVYQAVRGTDNHVYTRSSPNNGYTWSSWQTEGGSTLDRVSMNKHQNRLVQAIRGTDNQIYSRYTQDGVFWTNWEHSGATLSEVSMVTNGHQLIQTVRGTDNNIYTRILIGDEVVYDWSANGSSLNKVTSISYRGSVVQAVRGTDDALYIRYSIGTLFQNERSLWSYLTFNENNEIFRTNSDPTLYVYNNILYLSAVSDEGNVATFSYNNVPPIELKYTTGNFTHQNIKHVSNSGIDYVKADGSEIYNQGFQSLVSEDGSIKHIYYTTGLEDFSNATIEQGVELGTSHFPVDTFVTNGVMIQIVIGTDNVIYTRIGDFSAG